VLGQGQPVVWAKVSDSKRPALSRARNKRCDPEPERRQNPVCARPYGTMPFE
jgi:hypothetical protein